MSCFVIAEAGVNHNGSESLAAELVDLAADAGADAVKFQTFKAERLVTGSAQKAEYQSRETGEGSQLEMLKALELSEQAHERLVSRCRTLGIEFMSTAFDLESARFLVDLGIQRIKIPSGELTNLPFIGALCRFGLPVILSTGMANLDEVREAVSVIRREQAMHPVKLEGPPLVVLHCTSNYPAADGELNLRAMATMRDALNVPVGYSDHSEGIFVAPLATGLGATVLEKHFTTSRDLPGPDHRASLEPGELRNYVRMVRRAEAALGDGRKEPTASELAVRKAARRSITLVSDMKAGDVLRDEHLVMLRPGDGLSPARLAEVVGRPLKRDMRAGDTLQPEDLA